MKKYTKYLIFASLVLLISGIVGIFPRQSQAHSGLDYKTTNCLLPTTNPSFCSLTATSTALSAPIYMSGGNGTTSLSLYTPATDQIGFNILFNASSTSSVLNWRIEYSQDGQTWYSDDPGLSTSTVAVPGFQSYSWTFASSTAGTSQISYNLKHFTLNNVDSNYTRIVLYMPPTSAGGAIEVQAALKQLNTI